MNKKVIMKYLGKKEGITLSFKGLKERYYISGPNAEILVDPEDAKLIGEHSPNMFRSMGMKQVGEGPGSETFDVLSTVMSVKDERGVEIFRGTVKELCNAYMNLKSQQTKVQLGETPASELGIPSAEDMLKDDDANDELEKHGFTKDDSLSGDGYEGDDKPPEQKEDVKEPEPDTTTETVKDKTFASRLTTPELMKMDTPSLLTYALDRPFKKVIEELPKDIKRMQLIKKIRELDELEWNKIKSQGV